jgi:glucose/arabinose dehydrogenase
MRWWWLILLLGCGDETIAPLLDASLVDAGPCQPVLGEPELGLELVAEGFEKPVGAVALPGDPRVFVVEQHTARIRVVENGAIRAEPFVDLQGNVAKAMEQGLLALAFHPRFAENRRFFLSVVRPDQTLVVEEWRASAGEPLVAEAREKTLFEIPQDTSAFHYGGHIAFGPDGMLYLGRGDGGPQRDPEGHTQDMTLLFGKFLRVDVDREDPGLPYAIPADNPFADEDGVRGEIYVYGVRNPWAWSIDPATGHLYFGDVGFNRWEEINVIPWGQAGTNYGWPIVTGTECEVPGCDASGTIPPLLAYPWATLERCAAIGGHVYRGCRMPGYHGRYFYSDFCATWLRSFTWSALSPENVTVVDHAGVSGQLYLLSAIGLDGQGELLLLDWEEGKLYRVVPT